METIIAFFHYIILGLVQGLTEPLPISSSGHLRIAQHYFDLAVPDLHVEVFLNFASLLAVFIVYKSDISEIVRGLIAYIKTKGQEGKASVRLTLLVIVGTIPAVVIGGLFADFIGGSLTAIAIVGFALIITGILLWLVRNLNGDKEEGDITITDAVIVGFAQAAALAPGISRSGATLVAALARKIEPEVALKYSFFLSIPVGFGSMIFTLEDVSAGVMNPETMWLYLASFVVALVVSVFAIKVFIHVVTNGRLIYFAIYCFIVGGSLILFN
ncbi:undecaprenyl-diphosphate phosphatase [Halalkalibacillus halophilus]|uniref:undecaprenyl-diphosphate phosphatase n=1 Tax=Halalkalibacillus halophilus TaxID=392827 RepID=UPI000427516D|nr:undecaprenyl-diphosphate phosphatase [Halalkalibacillus halophilus]